VLALGGYGVWALAWQQVVAAACTSLLVWGLHPWRPAWVFSGSSARSLFGFGGYVLATNLLDTAFTRLYTVLVGKLFGVRELGFYNRADSTQKLPGGVLSQILLRVAFPVFSAANADKVQLRRGVRLSIRGVMLINAPAMLGLAAVAHPLIATLFGAQWLPAAPILEVLCLSGMLWPLHRINLTVLIAQGHSRLFFNLEAFKQSLGIALLAAGATMGVMGVAWAMVAFSVVSFFINAWYTSRYLGYSVAAQTGDVAPIIAISLAMAIVVHAFITTWHPASPVALVAGIALGMLLMALVTPLLRLAALREAIDLYRQRNAK
jgi:O-antigen/teichoic acid export membrane protein